MVDDRERLAELVERLETAYEAKRRRLQTDIAVRWDVPSGVTPEEMEDNNGRPVLLDALTALVNARTVLAQQPPLPAKVGPDVDRSFPFTSSHMGPQPRWVLLVPNGGIPGSAGPLDRYVCQPESFDLDQRYGQEATWRARLEVVAGIDGMAAGPEGGL